MKPSLAVGLVHEFCFRVPETKTVPELYPEAPEFRQMPRVFATGYLVGLLEWACMQAVHPHLDWPRELTLGTHIDVSHSAATPPGLQVSVRSTLIAVDGRRLVFDVQAHDGIDIVSRGTHERYIVERARFGDKLRLKQARAAPHDDALRVG